MGLINSIVKQLYFPLQKTLVKNQLRKEKNNLRNHKEEIS